MKKWFQRLNKKKKISLLVACIVLILGLIIGGYYIMQSPQVPEEDKGITNVGRGELFFNVNRTDSTAATNIAISGGVELKQIEDEDILSEIKQIESFDIYRSVDGGEFEQFATVKAQHHILDPEINEESEESSDEEKIAIASFEYEDKTVVPNRKYSYRVRVNHNGEMTDFSESSDIDTMMKPTDLLVIRGCSDTVGLNYWYGEAWDNLPTHYEIHRSTNNRNFNLLNTIEIGEEIQFGGAVYFSDDTASIDGQYFYKIRGVITKDGEKHFSPFSEVHSPQEVLRRTFELGPDDAIVEVSVQGHYFANFYGGYDTSISYNIGFKNFGEVNPGVAFRVNFFAENKNVGNIDFSADMSGQCGSISLTTNKDFSGVTNITITNVKVN